MKYPRLLAALRSARWAIQPASLQAIYDTLGAHLRGALPMPANPLHSSAPVSPEVLASLAAATVKTEASMVDASGKTVQPSPIAVIPVYGIIGKHLSSLETMCGGCDLVDVEEEIAAAIADTNVRAIVLDINSPGGVVTGVPELAAKIRAWNEQKPIFAFADSLCASAAYWLAASCIEIAITQTADVGSIGVYIALVDDSEWWKKEGFKLELIKAGEFKAMGISGKPLSDAERALLQTDVDTVYRMFTADVRAGGSGRALVADEAMQGQTFMGETAITAQLADRIVTDLGQMVGEINQNLSAPAA